MPEAKANYDPLVDELPSRYIVGIDLGTTNSAVTYIDTEKADQQIRVLKIPQLVAAGDIEARETLPSFHFQPAAGQIPPSSLRLSWSDEDPASCVGVMARHDGMQTAGRTIASAKSWLCHSGVDRSAAMLPWHGAQDVEQLSPVEASSRYLKHIREAWDAQHSNHRLAEQDVILTLPASFDEVARELTVQAAAAAGLRRVVLIEEPQAAFYAWVYRHQDDWQNLVRAGERILVCDIGGGTTDFTLIRVRKNENSLISGDVQFHRVAVGDHLVLGGDNLDLAIAKYIEQQLADGRPLPPRQWEIVLGRSRDVKEQLLSEHAPESITISLPAVGSKLLAKSRSFQLNREQIQEMILDGFLPIEPIDQRPALASSGFSEFGLPYASDPAISRYLGSFLKTHQDPETDTSARPDIVLFNGGFFASPILQERLLSLFDNWFGERPRALESDRLDLAVARGAAYYGRVRRGEGVRIAASLARSYYMGVEHGRGEDEMKAVCLVPGSAQPGDEFELGQQFKLRISQPVEFPVFVSSVRLADAIGEVLPVDSEQMKTLPSIRTVLKAKNRSETGEIDVRLRVVLTEIGTIELSCHQVDSARSWRLEFDVRSATQTDHSSQDSAGESQGVLDEDCWGECAAALGAVFCPEAAAKPGKLVKQLALVMGSSRDNWPMTVLRRIWAELMELEPGRHKSPAHEARWLNLLGYALRPGYGLALDDWRVVETWRGVNGKLIHSTGAVQTEALILWRRVAGGLNRGQQAALAEPWLAALRGLHRRVVQKNAGQTGSLRPEDCVEVLRLLGSLERLSVPHKVELGRLMVELLDNKKMTAASDALVWAIGRVGQRQPVYGPLGGVIPAEHAGRWIDAIMQHDTGPVARFAVVLMSRKMEDRYRDLEQEKRDGVIQWLAQNGASEHHIQLVRDGGSLSREEQGIVFGESLPQGLRLE